MSRKEPAGGLSRRDFVRAASAAAFVLSGRAVINPTEAWGLETKAIAPATMQTLIQVARDIYPHDRLPDRFYAIAVKDYDTKAATDPQLKALIENGIAGLNQAAKKAHGKAYIELGWEEDRVPLLRQIENTPFFKKVRSGLVTGLYNQKEIWPIFGYEGSSADKGGYIDRGFNDLNWL
jgi:hypothetical protein